MPTARLEKLREQLKEQNVDCMVLVPGPNLRYMTGTDFHLLERAFLTFYLPEGDPVVMLPDLEALKWESKVPYTSKLFTWNDKDGPGEAMRETVRALPELHKVAVEWLGMRMMEYDLLRRHFPNAEIVEGEAVMDPLRLRKDTAEVEAMRRAVKVAEEALEQTISGVKPGMTEREIASRLSIGMLEAGGEEASFEPLVLGGPRSALPHGAPTERPLEAGDILLIDFGTTIDGYASDITRCFIVGQEPDDTIRDMYEAVKAANEVGRALIKPGVTAHEIDIATHKSVEETGFGELFIHRTGHGLGLDIHEAPSIVEGNHFELDVGMTFTVEPGVYDLDIGGIRIEDNVVVTEDGVESLSTFSREMRIIGR